MQFIPTTYRIPMLNLDDGTTFFVEEQGFTLTNDEGNSTGLGYYTKLLPGTLDVVHAVTHLSSGYEFGIHFLSERETQRFMCGIAKLFDWNQNVQAIYAAFPSLRDSLREALYQAIGGMSQYNKKIVRLSKDTQQKIREMAREHALKEGVHV